MIKLFVSDMDGTLLNDDHAVSDRVAQAVRDLEAHGIEFLIATGRGFQSAHTPLYLQQLSPNMIILNGAALADFDGNYEYVHNMDPDIATAMIHYFKENDIDYSVMTKDYYFLTNAAIIRERLRSVVENSQKEADEDTTESQFEVDDSYIYDTEDYDEEKHGPVVKLMLIDRKQEAQQAFIDHFDHYDAIDIVSSGPHNLEITSSQAQKGLAIERYIQEKGYTMDQVATIGDSLNDRSMLQMAGYSFAMDNAPDEIKALAKFIAPSNAEDGVATVIYNIIEGRYNN